MPHKPKRKERERPGAAAVAASRQETREEDSEEIRAANSMVNCSLLGAKALNGNQFFSNSSLGKLLLLPAS